MGIAALGESQLAPKIREETIEASRFMSLDIETQNADKKDLRLQLESWKPPSTMKDPKDIEDKEKRKEQVIKLAAKRKEFEAKVIEKAALSDFAPIGTVSFWTGEEGAIFGCVKPKKPFRKIPKCPAVIYHHKNERLMLIAMREWLDNRTSVGMVLIGTNIKRFDNPHLRLRYIHHHLIAPKCLHPRAREAGVEVFDLMDEFLYKFTSEKSGQRFIKHDEIIRRLGIKSHKSTISGADVPGMLKRGEVMAVMLYNFLDTYTGFKGFCAMTGNINDPTFKDVSA